MRLEIKDKDYAISFLRMFALLLVIACHTFEYLGSDRCYPQYAAVLTPIGNYASVGVQIFLLISGYLYGMRTEASGVSFVLKNFWKILKDYYVHYLLFTIPLCLITGIYQINLNLIWGMITAWCTFGGEVQLWFIPYILFCYLITPMLYDVKTWMMSKKYLFFKFLCLLVTIELLFNEYNSYFTPAWICCYVIGYFVPQLLEKYRRYFNWMTFVGLVVVCVITNVVKYHWWYVKGNSPDVLSTMMAGGIFSGAWILNEFYNWSRVLLAIMLSIMTYTLFRYIRSKLGGTTRIRWLDMADKFSYDIYICHMLFVKGMLSTIMLTSNLMVNLLITGILAIVNGIVLYYICRPKELLTLCKRYRRNDDSLRGRGFAKKK